MAQETITIEFKPKGDQKLIAALEKLNIATKQLIQSTKKQSKSTKGLTKAQKQEREVIIQTNLLYYKRRKAMSAALAKQNNLKRSQDKLNKSTLFGVRNNRLLGNSFATIRSKLLLYSFAVGLAVAGFKKLFDKMIIQEKAEKKLEVALGKTSTSLLNYASALQQSTTFGDEAIIGAQAMIAAFIDDEEQIKLVTKATLDLATAKGMELSAAADLVSKTIGSSTNSLSRYGVEVKGAVGTTQRLESTVKSISDLFGGQAAAQADTLGGAVEQMTNAFGDANEAVGKAFAPVILKLSSYFKETAESAKEFFLSFTETEMEKTVRLNEEAGANAANLRLNLFETEKIDLERKFKQFPEQLNSSAEVIDKINSLEEVRVGRLRQQFKAQKLINDIGLKESQLKLFSSDLIKEEIDNLKEVIKWQKENNQTLDYESDFRQEINDGNTEGLELQLKNLETLRETAEAYLPIINHANEQVENSDTQIAQNKEFLEFLLQYEILLAKIKALEESGKGTAGIDLDAIKAGVAAFKLVSDAIKGASDAYFNMEMQSINQKKEADLAAAGSIKSERAREKAISKINAKAEKEEKKLRKENQKFRIMDAIANTAVGMTKAFELPTPLNFVIMALIAAQGAMQVATLTAQKFEKGGLVGGRRHSQGGTAIEAERGEFVMSRSAVSAVGIETMNRINAGGGAGNVNISFAGNVMSDDFIESEAIPKIKEAIRRGADIGVS